jgi:hypothetical protein
VHDAFLVSGFQAFSNLTKERDGFVDGDRTACDTLRQRLAFHELHDEEPLAIVLLQSMQRGDVRVIELSQEPRLSLESVHAFLVRRELLGLDLDRHVPTELRVLRSIHFTHTALANGLGDLEVTETGTSTERHG